MPDILFDLGSIGRYGGGVRASTAIAFQLNSQQLDRQLRADRGRFGGPLMNAFAGVHNEMARTVAESIQETLMKRVNANRRGGFTDTDRPRGGGSVDSGGFVSSGTSMRRQGGPAVPKTTQERLANIIIAQENLRYDSFRFSTFIREWMDASAAGPYWRYVDQGGRNPSAFITFSPGRGPRNSRKAGGITPEYFPGYHYVEDGVKLGLQRVRRRIGKEYVDAGISVGARITIAER